VSVENFATLAEALVHTRDGINDGHGLRYTGWKTNGIQALKEIGEEMSLLANQALIMDMLRKDLQHNTRRMLQALDAYWMNYEGHPLHKMPRGKYTAEDWWHRYEKYRALVVADL